MIRVEIAYCYERVDSAHLRNRPADGEEAMRRMDDGSQSFAALFSTLDGTAGSVRRVIYVNPRVLGLQETGPPEQRPYAAILGCSDARVPIELIFNEGPNDLFVVRVAGNTLGDDVLGSLNYAVEHLGESLKLVVVLGHSGCGAVTAAVDVYLDPAKYFAFASKHAIRRLVDRLQVIVAASAFRLEGAFGPEVRTRRGYREALIETAVVTNAAVSARTLQGEIKSVDGVRAAYGVYVIADRGIWAPRCDSSRVVGLADPPPTAEAFAAFGDAVIRSDRIAGLIVS